MNDRLRSRWLLPAGIVVAAAGVVVLVVAVRSAPEDFGWFAYAPLSRTAFAPAGPRLVSPTGVIGAGLTALGLMTLAFWAGLRVGRRSSR